MSQALPSDREAGIGPEPPPPDDLALAEEARRALRRASLKLGALIAVATGCLILVHATPLNRYLHDVQALKTQLRDLGAWGAWGFLAGTTLLVAGGVPRLLFSLVGGMAFGFSRGLALSLAGSVLGSYLTFLFARWGGRDWVQRRYPAPGTWRTRLDHPTVAGVFWFRQLPVAGVVTNLALGLTAVRHGVFLVGSGLGFLPAAGVVCLVGSGLGKSSSMLSFVQVGLALVAALVLLVGVRRWRRSGWYGTDSET
jgi:uncharacterized membrane protein YdjX (TVP38/TMEM64 family)